MGSLPTSPRTALFRAIVDILRTDPVLRKNVHTWRVWDGHKDDLGEPNARQSPFVRLTPGSVESNWGVTETSLTPLEILVDVYTSSTNADHLIDLWYAVERALYPSDEDRRELVQTKLGILNVQDQVDVLPPTVTMPGIEPVGTGEDTGLMAKGKIRITLYIRM